MTRTLTLLLCLLLLSACRSGAPEVAPETEEATPPSASSADEQDAAEADDEEAPAPAETQGASDPPPVPSDAAEALAERGIDVEQLTQLRARLGLIPPPPPRIDFLMYRSDLREITRYGGEIIAETLPGIDVTPHYNAIRFAMPPQLGCTLQRWQHGSITSLLPAYEQHRDTLLAPTPLPGLADAAVIAQYADVRTLLFRHHNSMSLYAVTCDQQIVSDAQLRQLVERILGRL